ncbi:helix-turn-helix domain-containing protein [Spartinivicinus marinus]|uniref:helix-turn-helix domain-containing protein n=1 Tax=Spartinivicinus marinus TaxID=2994442 RepID=UPI00224E3990|nr:helix-turn-helix domain-containing protein [Spartinivicinus marinus]MCX4024771.1 hypothetical protein [Spartinivicinus marinus]
MAKKKTKKPQRQIVTEHILKYGHITRNEAIGMYGITRLAAVVHDMTKNYDVPIIAKQEDTDYSYSFRWDFLDKVRDIKHARDLMHKHDFAFIH